MTAALAARADYLDGVDAGSFDHRAHMGSVLASLPDAWPEEDRALATPAARRVATRHDPLLFALIYLRHLLKSPAGEITFGDVHLELYRDALELAAPAGPKESRRAYAAPRGSGKSTTAFLAIPMWVACHHAEATGFVAAFSSSATQAEDHLAGLRRELHTNRLIRADYPDLCEPARKRNGTPIADSQSLMYTKSGFAFSARGIDTGVLGLVDPQNRRPQLLLLDDIEGEEGAGYSAYQASKRLGVLLDGILPMNDRAHVRLIGTTTLAGGVMHQLVKSVTEPGGPAQWIAEERFRTTYFPPLVKTPDGAERSLWPGRWPTAYLQSIRHTRVYAKAFANQPVRADGEYWSAGDFTYGDVDAARTVLEIDPAVTDKRTSDYTGLSVVAHQPATADTPPKCAVRHAEQVRLPPAKLRDKVLALLARFPEVGAVRIEINQGGDTWRSVLHDLPVKLLVHTESAPKPVRAANLLNHYQRGRVLHAHRHPELEEQMLAYPDTLHDDLIDTVGAAVRYLLTPRRKAGGRPVAYTSRGAAR